MNRSRGSVPSDNDSLQADVMRFLAIIAFILIAILTLVENLPPIDQRKNPELAEPATITAEPAPTPGNTPAEEMPSAPVQWSSDRQPTALNPAITTSAETSREPSAELPVRPSAEPSAGPSVEPTAEAASKTSTESSTAKTLTLRFSSDAAFLYLLGQEQIRLYGKDATGYQRMTPAFSLEPSALAGNLYEVMPASLPRVVRNVFRRQNTDDAEPAAYLVALPAGVHQRISQLQVNHQHQGGTLTINRKGEVNHDDA